MKRIIIFIILLIFIVTGCENKYSLQSNPNDIKFKIHDNNIKIINGSEELWIENIMIKSSEIRNLEEKFNLILAINNEDKTIEKLKKKKYKEEGFTINVSGIYNTKDQEKAISLDDMYYKLGTNKDNELLNLSDIKKEIKEKSLTTDNTFNYIYYNEDKYKITDKKVKFDELGTMLGNVKFREEDLFYAVYSVDDDKLLKKGEYNKLKIIPTEKSNKKYKIVQLGYVYKLLEKDVKDGFIVEKDNELFWAEAQR